MAFTFREISKGHDAYSGTMAFALFELDKKFFPTPWSRESWDELFSGHARSLTVVYRDDELVGFSLFDLSVADSFAHLLKILINPDFRKKGVAADLLKFALDSLQTQGLRHYFLEVEEDNHAAQKLYLSAGFKTIHRKKDFYGDGRAALIMTLDSE